MATEEQGPLGPDLSDGIPIDKLEDGKPFGGHLGDQDIVLVKNGNSIFAIDAHCTHYHGPLVEGLVVGNTIRCPWHHACFNLADGSAKAPALSRLTCWSVDVRDGNVFVGEKKSPPDPGTPESAPESVIIVGGGAAAQAAAETLRNKGYNGPVTMVSSDSSVPVDRPNLSKDYLAGTAPEEWIPLRGDEFYSENNIDLKLDTDVVSIDTDGKSISLSDGSSLDYGALLLATGASPVQLPVDGMELPHVYTLRSLADSRSIIQAVDDGAKRTVVIGASFIGLEVAASLLARDVEVHVVAPEDIPMARIMGEKLGRFVKNLHEKNGVSFHLGNTVTRIAADKVTLSDGSAIEADLVVSGVGVKPNVQLAQDAGITVDNGVVVDEYLQTNKEGVFAAGDIASWPDPHSGNRIRVEHWAVAERQGQTAAANILGEASPFNDVPFFWSQHYDATIAYTGHADSWDRIEMDGNPEDYDFSARFIKGDKTVALATIYRDTESLQFEAELESAVKA